MRRSIARFVAVVSSGARIDLLAPRLNSASIDPTGLILTLSFDEAITGNAGFTITPSGGAATLAYVTGEGSAGLQFDISRAIEEGETITLDYAAGDVEDLAENALATIEDRAVTNLVGIEDEATRLSEDGTTRLSEDGTARVSENAA